MMFQPFIFQAKSRPFPQPFPSRSFVAEKTSPNFGVPSFFFLGKSGTSIWNPLFVWNLSVCTTTIHVPNLCCFFLRSPWTKMMRFDRSKSSKMKFRFICQHFLLCFPYFKAKILHFWAEVTKTLWLRAGPWVRYHDVSYGSPYRRRWWPRLKPSWLMVDPNTENTATQKRSWAELRILGSTLPETNSSPLKMVVFPIGISKLPWVNVQRLCFLFREGNCK